MTTMDAMARAMFAAAYGEGHTITYDRLPHDGDPVKDGIFCKPYWHALARAGAAELRMAMLGKDAVEAAVHGVRYILETEQHYDDMRVGITAAWDALFSDEEGAK